MATQRYISTSFWDDEWVVSLSKDEKLTYLYLMTNTLTNIAGVYKITVRRMAYDLDMDRLSIGNILERFEKDKKAYYRGEYIVIPSWPKHQKTESHPKIKAGIYAVLDSLSPELISFMKTVNYAFDLSKYDSLSVGYVYPPNYSDPDTDTDRDISILSGKPDIVPFHWEVLDYLNQKAGRQYKRVHAHANRIKARISEGYTLEDFKKVIDFKVSEWMGKDDFEQYLRPETIFGTKFDSYLAQAKPRVEPEAQGGSAQNDSPEFAEMLQAVKDRYANLN